MKTASLLLAVAFLVSCGGKPASKVDEPKKGPPQPPPGVAGGPGGPAAPQAAPAPETPGGANARFTILRPYFVQFALRPLDGKVNIFKTNLAAFAPHVEIEVSSENPTDEPKTPLEYYDVDSYKLVIIMSGIPQPKALVIDPKDKSYVIQEGTKIGNRGGKIAAITATEVRIEEPGHPPTVKALEPPWVEMQKTLQSVQEF